MNELVNDHGKVEIVVVDGFMCQCCTAERLEIGHF